MDAETWMNAKEAKKLGFADEILFADGEKPLSDEPDEDDDNPDDQLMLFSRKSVTDSLLSKLIPKRSIVTHEEMKPAIKASELRKRLSLLSH